MKEKKTDLLVKPGSLFPALHRMEEAGWLKHSWGESENNRRAKYYRLTKAGQRQLEVETEDWKRIAMAITSARKSTWEAVCHYCRAYQASGVTSCIKTV